MKKIYRASTSKSEKVYIPKEVRKLLETDKIAFQVIDHKIKIVPVKRTGALLDNVWKINKHF